MFKRKDFKVITVAVDNCDSSVSLLHGILISENNRWLYFWKVVDFRIDGRVLVRKSQVLGDGHRPQKMSKLQYRAMKTLGELDKIDSESEVELPESEKKMLKQLVNKTSTVISTETDDHIGDIKKVGKNRISFNKFTPKGNTVFGDSRVNIEDVHMLHINSERAQIYSLFSK